ncbi:OmpA family protein [Sphingobium sp.]|uniref:OmpA family protein n=1 Tax=Sphingobium sp. TaxID=1912891 RepID=UPI003B3B1FF2
MTRFAPAIVTISIALAACQPPADKDATAAGHEAENLLTANVAENAGEPQRSILRPEVVPEVEEPKIEPADALIGFGASAMALDDAAKTALDALIDTPAMKEGGPITLRGHSDSRGNDGDNRVASRIRAEKVRDYLVGKGVDKARISIVALGESRPIAPNATEDGKDDPEGRAKNRRVEAHVALPTIVVPPPVVANQSEAAKKNEAAKQ